MRKRVIILILIFILLASVTQSTFVAGADAASKPATSGVVADQSNVPNNQLNSDNWSTVAANPERTSWTSEEVRGDLTPKWYRHFDSYISQKVQIIAVDGTLYISTAEGLYALNANTGTEKWFYPTELPLGHSPTIYNGVAYVGSFDHKIHAINIANGSGIWTFEGGKGFHTNPLVVEVGGKTMVYAGNRDGKFYAIEDRGSSPYLDWQYNTDGPILYSAAYKDGELYFASNDMYAYALNAQTGGLLWKSDKLPGHGFHSWWPVVYRNYVVFNGGWNYRMVEPYPNAGNHNIIEREDVYPLTAQPGDPIGPVGTEPGDWAAGTTTINAYRITDYFEDKPWRRTSFMLNRSNGQEYTFDYDNDGKQEYAPFLYYGAKGGTRYPSAVGPDDVLYQTNNYQYNSWIPRGQVTGWKTGTPFISIPYDGTNAVDEPLAFSIGGNVVYTRLCCDREAKAFDLRTNDSWMYYGQGSDTLRRYLPTLFEKGWPFGYWKHGDPSPPIPHQGQVYIIANNAVVAFSSDGGDYVIPPNEDRGLNTGADPDDIERSTVVTGLNTKATLSNSTWPLLIQQETYYDPNYRHSARARYFPLFEVAGSGSANPTSLNRQDTTIATILTSTFSGGQTLTTRVSRRSPTILFETTGNSYTVEGSLAGIAYPTSGGVNVSTGSTTINGSQLSEGWVLIWDDTATHRWSPVILSFQNRPSQIAFNSSGLNISFSAAGGYLATTPLYGMSNPKPAEESSWPGGIPQSTVNRIRLLDSTARSFPVDVTESWSINSAGGDASFTYNYSYIEFSDSWNSQVRRMAYVPPRTALAAWNNSPIRINGQTLDQHLDLDYLTPLGRVAGVSNSDTVTVRLPTIANYWRDIPSAPSPASPTDPVQIELANQIQAMLDAGHLRPGYAISGIWDGIARGNVGDNLADLWHSPGHTIYALLRSMPLLPTAMQQDIRQYVQNEFQAYPPYDTSHVGWANGAARERFDLPPEAEAARSTFPACSANCNNSWGLPQENFYAMWMYANEFGSAGAIFNNAQNKLDTSPDFIQSMPYMLNAYITGYVGYLRLANLAGQGWEQSVEKILIELFIIKAASMKYPDALAETGFEYSGDMWSMRTYAPNHQDTLFNVATIGTLWSQMPLYGYEIDLKYGLSGAGNGGAYTFGIDFVNLVPELSHFLHDYALSEVQNKITDYEGRAPYWFVAEAEEMAGEGTLRPLYDTVALFQAKAQILGESRTALEKYLDVSPYKRGDLFYIQNLTALLEEGDYTGIADFSLGATPTTQQISSGSQTAYTVQVGAIGDFNANVSITASPPSPTFTHALNPTSGTPPYTATLTVNHALGGAVPSPGLLYTIPVSATDGSTTKSTRVSLQIEPEAPSDFSLNVTPATQQISSGSQTAYTVQVGAIGNFNSSVSIMASSPSPTVTHILNPTSGTPPYNATLTVNHTLRGEVPFPGLLYTIPVSATDGATTKSTNVSLQIAPNSFVGVKWVYLPAVVKNN